MQLDNDPDLSFDLEHDFPSDDYYQCFSQPLSPSSPQLPPPPPCNAPPGCHGVPPPFKPLPSPNCYTSFKTLDQAIQIAKSLNNINSCFIAIPLISIASIRNDKRRPSISGYIIHH